MPAWTLGERERPGDAERPAALLLHGISADHTEWSAVAARLAPDVRVVLPDLLGRGASRPTAAASFGLADELARLELLLDVLELDRPLLAGHSHGATLALALARRRPVSGVLLASPVTPWTRRPAPLSLLAFRPVRRAVEPVLRTCRVPLTRYILTRRVYGGHAPDLDDAVRRYAAPFADPARGRALLRVFRDWRPAELERFARSSADFGAPIRVITGSADRRIRPADAQRWAERLGARSEVVDGAGHGLTEEAPDRVADVLREMAGPRREGGPRDGRTELEQRDR